MNKRKEIHHYTVPISQKMFFYSAFIIFLIIPFYIMGWPTAQGPYAYSYTYFFWLSFFLIYPIFAYNNLKKKNSVHLQILIKRYIGFISFFMVFSLFFIGIECGFRVTRIADWGGGQGPLQRDWKLRNYIVNEEGFRGPDIPFQKGKNIVRIMGTGDSFGFGQGVQWEETYLEQLRYMLLKKRPDIRIETINKAQPGWNTIDEYNYCVATGTKYTPDILIILFVLNDAEFNGYALKPLINMPYIEPMLQRSHVYYYLVRAYNARVNPYNTYIKNLYQEGSQTAEYCQKALREFGKLCKRDNIIPVVAICPLLTDFEKYEFTSMHQHVYMWARLSGLHAVDLLPYFKKANIPAQQLRVSSQDWHPNGRGHQIIAEALCDIVLEYLK